MFKYGEEVHHSQEDEEPEDHEIFHGVAVGAAFPLALLFGMGENERFVGIAECLGEHHHDYGDLHVGAVDAYHRTRFGLMSLKQVWNDQLPHVLAQDSGHTEY